MSITAESIIIRPVVSEKNSRLSHAGTYAFQVDSRANKLQIAGAVRHVYGVAVEEVRIVNMPRKRVRRGRTLGWKAGFKKALVTLSPGHKIETV